MDISPNFRLMKLGIMDVLYMSITFNIDKETLNSEEWERLCDLFILLAELDQKYQF